MKRQKQIYPKRLLPNVNYKEIVDSSKLDKYYVLRYTEKDAHENLDRLREEHFGAQKFYNGVSVNLLSVYKKKDAKMIISNQKLEYSAPWVSDTGNPSFAPPIIPLNEDIIVRKDRGFAGLKIRDIHQIYLSGEDLYNTLKKLPANIDHCKLAIVHKPTRSNFWHFEIYVQVKYNGDYLILGKNQTNFEEKDVEKIARTISKKMIAPKIVIRKQMRRKYLPKSIYKITNKKNNSN